MTKNETGYLEFIVLKIPVLRNDTILIIIS